MQYRSSNRAKTETPLSQNTFTLIFFFLLTPYPILRASPSPPPCRSTCGSLQIKYPFGTGYGCGSPRIHPYVVCSPLPGGGEQLLLNTHAGDYPIASISYATSTLTVTPPSMSTCTTMQRASNLGLDWASPFQLGPSTLILLSCAPPTSSLVVNGYPACDLSSDQLCASIYTCPSVVDFGLPLFPATNSCCVYSPANLDNNDELDLRDLKCAGYASVVSFSDYPTDPTRWEYGVAVKYTRGAFDDYNIDIKCRACESSGGACGYKPRDHSFVCVCSGGFNTTMDCHGSNYNPYFMEDENLSPALPTPTYTIGKLWSALVVGMMVF